MTNTEKNVKLEPIVCQDCGASVPLPDEAQTSCPYCSASIETPEEYLKWRKSHQEALQKEERLLEIHKELGQNPSVLERAIVAVTGCAGGCVGCCLMPFIALFLWLYATAGIMFLLGALSSLFPDLVLGKGTLHYLINAVMMLPAAFIVSFLGISLAVLKRKVIVKMALQGALVAGEPAHPGGPSTCRSCGAPLSVKPGKLCVPCYYCSTQNLVSLESGWVKQVKESADKKVKSLTQAINYFEEQNMIFKARKYTYTAIATIMLIIGGLITVKTDVAPVKEKSLDFLITNNQLRSSSPGEANLYLDLPITIKPGSAKTSVQYGYFQSENLEFYLALAEKERLQVEILKSGAELSLEVVFSKVTLTTQKRKKDKVQLLEKAELSDSKKVEFTANEKGLYSLFVNLPTQEQHQELLQLKLSVTDRPTTKPRKLDLAKIKINGYSLGDQFSGKDKHKKDELGWNVGTGNWATVGFDRKWFIRSIEGQKLSISETEVFDQKNPIFKALAHYRPDSQLLDCEENQIIFTFKQKNMCLELLPAREGIVKKAKIFETKPAEN